MKTNGRLAFVCAIVLTLIWMAVSTLSVSAKDLSITLGPGETARIPMKFWCLDFGKPFPTAISGPSGSASDAIRKVLEAARAKGSLTSNPYQTQLAIWKAADGAYHDVGSEGHVLAEQIVNAAATVNLVPVPSGATVLAQAVGQGTLKTSVENFKVISNTTPNIGQPFMGTGVLVIQNTSNQKVSFVLVEGTVFKPAGVNEQTLLSHQDPDQPATLPKTGIEQGGNLGWNWLAVAGLLLTAGLVLGASRWLEKTPAARLWVG